MKNRLFVLAASVFLLSTVNAQTQQTPIPDFMQAIGKVVGKAGTLNADGSYRINLPRKDVTFTHASGMPIDADLGLATYIAISGTQDNCLAVGDVAMLEGEIDAVIDNLRAGGFEVVALHNHMTTEEPRLFFLHFQVTGKSDAIANTFRKAIGVLGHGTPRPLLGKPGKPKLDTDAISAVFGAKPQVFPSGVLRYANPRKDTAVTINDQKFTPGMGMASWAAFYACECGQTLVMGDTCAFRSDLQQAIDAFRKGGIHITSIHNHTLGGSSEVIFMHYEGEGDALKLAAGIKSCWNVLGAK